MSHSTFLGSIIFSWLAWESFGEKAKDVYRASLRRRVAAHSSCCEHQHDSETPKVCVSQQNSPLWARLWAPATVVTLEPKYAVCGCAAEFWCSITSLVFAAPCLAYLWFPIEVIPWQAHACCILSFITALVSAAYHWTLYKIFSSLDAAMACLTIHLFTLLVNNRVWPELDAWLANPTVWTTSAVLVLGHILRRWEHTARPTVQLMGGIIVFYTYALFYLGLWTSAITGWFGVVCFLADRKGYAPVHSFWHIGGGLSLAATMFAVLYQCVDQQEELLVFS